MAKDINALDGQGENIDPGKRNFIKTWLSVLALSVVSWVTGKATETLADEVQVADASGKVTLANYKEIGDLTDADIQAGMQELAKGFMSDGDSESEARGYAKETIENFLNWKDDGGAEYIAKYSPEFTAKILKNPEQYTLSIDLDTEVKKIEIEAINADTEIKKAEIEAKKAEIATINADTEAKKANIARLEELQWDIDTITKQLSN